MKDRARRFQPRAWDGIRRRNSAGEAPTGSIASKYLSFKGARHVAARALGADVRDERADGGRELPAVAGGINIGSPLTSGLGKQDLSYVGNSSKPGVGSGL